MATAPKAIWDLWYRIEALYNGPGLQDEELAGIVGDRAHSFGFHLAPNELPSSDYSLQTARDKAGARSYPGDASALDVHFGPAGMVTVTKRLVAAANARDPRMNALYEFCGTTNGRTPHPYTVDTHSDDPNNNQGWDSSHVTHVHLSIHRDVSHNFAAIMGVADVMAGTTQPTPTPIEEIDMSNSFCYAIDGKTLPKGWGGGNCFLKESGGAPLGPMSAGAIMGIAKAISQPGVTSLASLPVFTHDDHVKLGGS